MAAEAPEMRPPLCGWLLKAKSETAKSRLLKSTNRRYFTLDFQTQIFYYAHTEGKKTVSMPTHFRAILGVEPFADTGRDPGEEEQEGEKEAAPTMQRSASKGSLASSLRRIPSMSSLSKKPMERHGFVVRTQGKSLELICGSKEEAGKWIDAIRQAMDMAQCAATSCKDVDFQEALARAELSTEPGSSRGTSPRSSHGSLGGSRQATPPVAPAGRDEAFAAPASLDASPADARRPAKPATPPADAGAPPPAAAVWVAESLSAASSPTASSMPAPALSLVPPRSARSTSSGDRRSPRQGYVTSVKSEAADDAAFKCWGGAREDADRDVDMKARYSDKGQGLSINQRLSQMEFSDDEDSDEFGGARSTSAKLAEDVDKLLKEADQPPESVVVEACETFVAPDGDSDTE